MKVTLSTLENIGSNELFKGADIDQFVLDTYMSWCNEHPEETAYISTLEDHIKTFLPPLSEKQTENLGSHVYYASQKKKEIILEKEKENMSICGYNEITPEMVKEAHKEKRKIEVVRYGYNMLCGDTKSEPKKYRPFVGEDGTTGIIPPRNRKNGIGIPYMGDNRLYGKIL